VLDLRLTDKPGKAAYIRDKKQPFAFHGFSFKITANKWL
jgi:hypothetical protein